MNVLLRWLFYVFNIWWNSQYLFFNNKCIVYQPYQHYTRVVTVNVARKHYFLETSKYVRVCYTSNWNWLDVKYGSRNAEYMKLEFVNCKVLTDQQLSCSLCNLMHISVFLFFKNSYQVGAQSTGAQS